MRLHAVLKGSLANGPRRAAVVWFQGCFRRCPGCCNPQTHDQYGGYEREVDDVANEIIEDGSIGGMTLTGGEPLDQFDSALHLVTVVHRMRPELCIVLFTGHELDHPSFLEYIRDQTKVPWEEARIKVDRLFAQIDVLVEGPYDRTKPGKDPLVASSNQKVSFPSGRYGPNDLIDIPRVEVFINEEGEIIETGFGCVLSHGG